MQQVLGAAGAGSSPGGNSLPQDGSTERYVINLSASTTPVALTPPARPELRRFSFFVTRKLEAGRERFRLHMGYFDSQQEAERMLELVREVYPAAWAGPAPGQRLRARSTQPAAPAAPAAARPVVPAPSAATVAAPAPVRAAAQATSPAPTVIPFPQPLATRDAARSAVPPGPDVLPRAAPTAAAAAPPAAAVAPGAAARPGAAAQPRAAQAPAAQALSQIRATLNSLSGPETLALLESPPRTLPRMDLARADSATVRMPAPARAPVADAQAAPAAKVQPRATARGAASPAPAARAGVEAPPAADVPAYAVQLLWSVQPIDMGKVPRLAIFSAYRLYGAEGNRDGRRWYGLRLGFFNDSSAARQVAQYVRSEFKSVSVVPVSERERERASRTAAQPLPAAKSDSGPAHGLQFIDEVQTDTATSGNRPAINQTADEAEAAWAEAARAAVQIPQQPRKPTGKRVKLRVGNQAASKHPGRPAAHKPPETLEQTLEALGASTLQMEKDRGERVVFESTMGGVGKPAPGNKRFGKLLDNLARRFGGT